MKTFNFKFAAITLLLVLAAVDLACAQSRTNRLQRPCPSTSTPAVVEIQKDGDINLHPCPSKSLLVNDAPLSSSVSFGGSSRTSFVPYYSAENTLSKSPFSWNGTLYRFDNGAGSATFRFDLTPDSAGNGAFRFGNTTNALNYFRLDQNGSVAQLAARNAAIGDMNNSGNGNVVVLNDLSGTLTYQNAARTMIEASATDRTVKLGDPGSDAYLHLDSGSGSVTLGDVLGMDGGTVVLVDDPGRTVAAGNGSAMVEANGLAGTVRLGDINNVIANSVKLTVDAPNAQIIAGNANALLRIDRGDGTSSLGDVNDTANRSKLYIDDNAATAALMGQIVQLGDVTRSGNSTSLNIADADRSIAFTTQKLMVSRQITPAGLTDAQTINLPSGTINIDPGASSNYVTNSTVTANSIIFAVARTNDATCAVKSVVPAAGSFTINMTTACTAETSVGFLVTN